MMNYGEKELLHERINRIERKNSQRREISFYLNDFVQESEKNYYFNFETADDGLVKISAEADAELNLKIGEAHVVCDEYFYLTKGVWEVLVNAKSSSVVGEIKVKVIGEVLYHDVNDVKVLNAEGYSVIALFSAGLLSLYKYDTQPILIESLEVNSYDMQLTDEGVCVYTYNGESLQRRDYLENLSACVVSEYSIENVTQIKCSNEGLYVVKNGNMYLATLEEGKVNLVENLLRVKHLFAVENGRAVYRDYDGKIKLCSFSVSP